MSKYSDLDAHSRNCPSCIRQRDSQTDGKKLSVPCRRLSDSSTKIRRSNSSLSYTDLGCDKDGDCTTYLTPTQRKNNEIRRLRTELNRANETVQAKEKEITALRSELSKVKSGQDSCEAASIPDSGNCEDQDSDPDSRTVLQGIDFELMESTLREEEETRQQLALENEELKFQEENLHQELRALKELHTEELQNLHEDYKQEIQQLKLQFNDKTKEILTELSESTLRCARQQTIIENKQQLIDDQSAINQTLTSRLSVLETEVSNQSAEKGFTETRQVRVSTGIQCSLLDGSVVNITKATTPTQYLTQPNVDVCVQTESPAKCADSQIQVEMFPELTDHPNTHPDQDPAKDSVVFTYQFLRRSIYYFLTDKDNKDYHLKSIERLLQFTDGEKQIIDRHKPVKRY